MPCVEDHSSYVVGLTSRSLSIANHNHLLQLWQVPKVGVCAFLGESLKPIEQDVQHLHGPDGPHGPHGPLWYAPASTLPLPFSSALVTTPYWELHLNNTTGSSHSMRWPWPPSDLDVLVPQLELHVFLSMWQILTQTVRIQSKPGSSGLRRPCQDVELFDLPVYHGALCKLILYRLLSILTLPPGDQDIMRE